MVAVDYTSVFLYHIFSPSRISTKKVQVTLRQSTNSLTTYGTLGTNPQELDGELSHATRAPCSSVP